jgi:hypothetical protein
MTVRVASRRRSQVELFVHCAWGTRRRAQCVSLAFDAWFASRAARACAARARALVAAGNAVDHVHTLVLLTRVPRSRAWSRR